MRSRYYHQLLQIESWIVLFDLRKAGVYDEGDPIKSYTCFSYISSYYHFAIVKGRGLEDFHLLNERHTSIASLTEDR